MPYTFRRNRHGEVVARLHPEELDLLRRLPDELRPLVDPPAATGVPPADADADPGAEGDADGADGADGATEGDADAAPAGSGWGPDPVRRRLFPSAYLDPTEEKAEQDWQHMVHPELVRTKLEALALLAATLDRAAVNRDHAQIVLSPDEVEAWLGALNDARLALGVALGVSDDTGDVLTSPDPERAPGFAVYTWLTGLQGELVDVLLG